MSPADLLDLLTQITFLWVAGSTVFNWGKQRDQTRFDIALIFVALAIAILALDLQRVLPEWETLLSLVLLMMILAHPYLLLRVAHYFHPHSKNIHRLALVGLLVVSGSVFFSENFEVPVIAGLIVYFALVQGYATYLLIRGALTIPGLTAKRLRLASIGSGLFGLVFVIALVVALVGLVAEVPPVIQELSGSLIQVLAVLSGLTYFFGFAPPRALRRLWQLSELHRFLQQTSRQLSEHRMVALDELAAAAMRTVGGSGVVIARCDTAGQHLTLDLPGSPPQKLPELHARNRTGLVWYERPARVEPVPGDTWPEINRWGLDEQARCLFIVPIRSPLRPWGLMIIALRYAPLFAQDDLELLTLIAEQSAIPLDYAPLVEELQVTNRSLEQRVVERTAQLEKINRDLELQIADRKRAEGNLQKSEARYLSTLDTMMEGCQVIGFDWTYRYVNEAAARQGRHTQEGLLGHTMMEIYPGIESTALFKALQRCIDERVPHQMENKFQYPDGSRGWFELSIQPVPEGVFILSVDISERKKAELALLESEARKAAILETALDCIVTVDKDGRILEFNPAAERTFGRTLDAVLGGEMAALLFPDELAGRIRLEFDNYLATRENMILGKRIELTGKRPDGTEFPMEMTLARVTNSDPPVFTGFLRDITDRKLVEAAIREREARYRHIFESTPVAVWEQDFTDVRRVVDDLTSRGITDVRKHFSEQADLTRQTMSLVRVLDVNQQSLTLFGASSKTEFMESLEQIVLPETLALFVEELAALAESRTHFEGETRMKTLQGDVRDILLTIHFPETGGRLDHTLVSLVDITARRLAEESILRSQTQLAGIINSAMDAIISIDENQRILIFNPAAEKMFQRFSDKVIGKPLSMLIPDRFRAPHVVDVRGFGESGVSKRTMGRMEAVRGLRLNGDEFPMEASISQIEVNGRKIYTAILRDITERKRAEEALRDSESKFRTLFETMNEGFSVNEILCNEAGEPYDLRYLEVNPAFETQTGLKSADILGRTTLELFPDTEPIWIERYGKVALTGEPAHFEARFGPLGRWFEVNAYQTVPGRFAVVFFDTTERKLAQEELNRLNADLERRVAERTSQLASAIRELEAFSYSVSHDLRAPLRSIDGFSQALLEDYGDQIPSEGRSYLDRVRAAAQRMALLIDDLLALSRVTRTPVARKPVDLSSLAERILADLRLEQPGRSVSQSIAPNLVVDGDENLLQIALRNLLTNAWKFTSKKEQARIEFGMQDGADGRVFYVRDNGSGFDMTYVDKLFGAFQRLHSIDDFPGTGIGLATVQRILHKHGGKVWAVGEVDQGATFYFVL